MDIIFDNRRAELRKTETRRKTAKAVRILTLPPFAALALVLILRAQMPGFFAGWAEAAACVFCLTVLPVSAYPLQPLFPAFRGKGRAAQRELAIWMSGAGYVLGVGAVFLLGAGEGVKFMMLTYFLSGALMLLLNRVLDIRASGHACGVAGPAMLLALCFGARALPAALVVAAVYWASLAMRRHKLSELIWGTLIPAAAMLASGWLVGFLR